MKPTVSVLDARFVYTDAANTDIRKLFARIRSERKTASQLARQETEANQASVQSIFAKRIREAK